MGKCLDQCEEVFFLLRKMQASITMLYIHARAEAVSMPSKTILRTDESLPSPLLTRSITLDERFPPDR